MTDRLHRERTLPEGYQFGDARPEPISLEGATILIDGVRHVLHEPGWNVIEGERFESDADHHRVIEGAR